MMTPQEWQDAEGVIGLPEVLVGLEHVREDLDMIDEALSYHRHQSNDPARMLELHAINDTVNRAWAATAEAHTALGALLAVTP